MQIAVRIGSAEEVVGGRDDRRHLGAIAAAKAMTARRKHRPFADGLANVANRPVPALPDHSTARAENAKKRP
jgi:hypothetical protein